MDQEQVVVLHFDVGHSVRRAWKLAGVRLTLAQVAPARRVEAETALLSLDGDVNDARPRDGSKRGELRDVVDGIGLGRIHGLRHSSRSPEMR